MNRKYVVFEFPGLKSRGTRSTGGLQSVVPTAPGMAASASHEADILIREATIAEESDTQPIRTEEQFALPEALVASIIAPLKVSTAALPTVDQTFISIGAMNSRYSGAGVKIAILDSGIDRSHVAFNGVNIVGKNFTGDGAEDNISDFNGHGTHCASTIFGRDVNGTRIGVARGVTDVLIAKVLNSTGTGSIVGVLRAIEWAISNGAQIISMSLRFDYASSVEYFQAQGMSQNVAVTEVLEAYANAIRVFESYAELLDDKDYSNGTGAIIFAATGNDSDRRLVPPSIMKAALPSGAKGVVSVGSVNVSDPADFTISLFSNNSPSIVAPGEEVWGAEANSPNNNGLIAMSGTSMACPHVAGVAALLWEQRRRSGRLSRGAALDVKTNLLSLAIDPGTNGPMAKTSFADVGDGFLQAPS